MTRSSSTSASNVTEFQGLRTIGIRAKMLQTGLYLPATSFCRFLSKATMDACWKAHMEPTKLVEADVCAMFLSDSVVANRFFSQEQSNLNASSSCCAARHGWCSHCYGFQWTWWSVVLSVRVWCFVQSQLAHSHPFQPQENITISQRLKSYPGC